LSPQINIEEAQNYIKTLGAELPKEQISQLITQFINLRILRDKDEADRYELRHDALAAKIFEKITLAEKELLEIRQFIEHAFDNYQKREILLSQEDLDYVQPFVIQLHLPEDLNGFIEKSQYITREQIRKQKKLSIWSLLIFWVILIFLISQVTYAMYYYIQSKKGESVIFNKEIAPVKSLLKSIKVLEEHNLSNTKKSMMDSFLEVCRHLDRIDSLKRENGKAWSDFSIVEMDREIIKMGKVSSSNQYFTLDSALKIQIWDQNFNIGSSYQLSDLPQEIKFSNNGETMAFLDADTSLYLYLKGVQVYKKKIITPKDLLKKFFAISPNGNYLCFVDQGNVFYYNTKSQVLNQFETGGHLIKVLDYSNENNICACLSKDSTIMTYKMNEDSIFLFSHFNLPSSSDAVYKDIELTNDAKYILVNFSLWNTYNKIRICKINGEAPKSGRFVEEHGRGMKDYLSDIELVNDSGIVYYYYKGIITPITDNSYLPRKVQASFSINHLYQNDLSYKLLKYTQKPIVYMEAANDFERFIIQYRSNEFELINNGISIRKFEYPYIMFSYDETKIIGFKKNKIYSFPISIISIKKYFQPYELKKLRHIDPSGLH